MMPLLLMLSPLLAGQAPHAPASPVCILSYNIHHGEGMDGKIDLDRVAAVIRAHNPDVVCLQEVDRNLPRSGKLDFPAELEKRLGMRAVFGPNYFFDGGEYGNMVLTRLEMVSHENHPLPGGPALEPRGVLRVALNAGGAQFDVFATHLGLRPDERKAQASALVALLGAGPAVLAGDLNETVDKPALAILLGRLRDSMPAEKQAPTIPAGAPRKRIDYVLVKGMDAVSCRTVTEPPADIASDHLPVVAEVMAARPPRQVPPPLRDDPSEQLQDAAGR